MKKQILILPILFIMMPLVICQEASKNKIRELYLSSYSLTGNNFGIQFKTSINDMTFLRYSLLKVYANQLNNIPADSNTFKTHTFNFQGKIQFGLEKRINITDKGILYYGIDAIGQTTFNRSKVDNPQISKDLRKMDSYTLNPGIGILMGIMVNIKDNFYIAGEIEPEFLYLYSASDNFTQNKFKRTGFDINLDSKTVRLSIIYKWETNASR